MIEYLEAKIFTIQTWITIKVNGGLETPPKWSNFCPLRYTRLELKKNPGCKRPKIGGIWKMRKSSGLLRDIKTWGMTRQLSSLGFTVSLISRTECCFTITSHRQISPRKGYFLPTHRTLFSNTHQTPAKPQWKTLHANPSVSVTSSTQLIFHTLFLSARLGSRWCQPKSPTRIVLAEQNRQLIFYPSHIPSSPAKMVWMRKAAADLPGPAEPEGWLQYSCAGLQQNSKTAYLFSHPMVLRFTHLR